LGKIGVGYVTVTEDAGHGQVLIADGV
jgi:hypothetical protein